MSRKLSFLCLVINIIACSGGAGADAGGSALAQDRVAAIPDSSFARLLEELSEPGGYFDTDNLISNETSYLHVIGKLEALGMEGGAYIGVGPDQSFSYIAQLRPSVAYILDIRRDNMLQHLLFKSLFMLADSRVEYMSLLFARPPPNEREARGAADIEELVEYVDGTEADPRLLARSMEAVARTLSQLGLELSEDDRATIRRFHATFARAGLGLRFSSHHRAPLPDYPTYRRLLLERDLRGRRSSYLADEEDYRYLRSLQRANLIIPVVGDFAGDHALRAIGRDMVARGVRVGAFYTSNVELYLTRDGVFDRFVANLASLPFDERSLIIRSYFARGFMPRHPFGVRGHVSTQLLQPIESLVSHFRAGDLNGYYELVTIDAIDPR